MEKKNMTCDYCKKKGYGRDTYFKLYDLNWFKKMTNKKLIIASNIVGLNTMKEDLKHGSVEFDLKVFIKN